jgi:hypothetical protein
MVIIIMEMLVVSCPFITFQILVMIHFFMCLQLELLIVPIRLLLFKIVNYKANNDSGIVIQKNIQLNNFPAFDALMAVRHGNGRDWWLIFQRVV